MTRPSAHLWLSIALACSTTAAGCTFGNTDLVPVAYQGGTIDVDAGWAEHTKSGVTVRATPFWDGDDMLLQHITPVHLRIENRSGRPLRLRYSVFTASTPTEEKRHALPVIDFQHDDSVDGLSATRKLDASGFEIFAHLADEFPGVPVTSLPKAYPDEAYHNRFRRKLQRMPFQIEDRVLIEALPEGVLLDGGHVSGFVYFREVEDDMDAIGSTADNPRVSVIVEFVDATTGKPFGQVELPFEID